jgi:hypothetical protein
MLVCVVHSDNGYTSLSQVVSWSSTYNWSYAKSLPKYINGSRGRYILLRLELFEVMSEHPLKGFFSAAYFDNDSSHECALFLSCSLRKITMPNVYFLAVVSSNC